MRDMTEHGAYGCTTYTRRFGSSEKRLKHSTTSKTTPSRKSGAAYECENRGTTL